MLGLGRTVMDAERDAAVGVTEVLNGLVQAAEALQRQAGPESKLRSLMGPVLVMTSPDSLAEAARAVLGPVLMGNAVLWKPSSMGTYPAHFLWRLLKEAGLPDGVLSLLPGDGAEILEGTLQHPSLAAVHYVGRSLAALRVSERVERTRCGLPVDLDTRRGAVLFAHPDCDVMALAAACVRGAFAAQGQTRVSLKRAYIPQSLHDVFRPTFARLMREVKTGSVENFAHFMGPVRSAQVLAQIVSVLEEVRQTRETKILFGGHCDDRTGYFVDGTAVMTSNPDLPLLKEDLDGPVLVLWVYPDQDMDTALALAAERPVAAAGVFARQRTDIEKLRSAWNCDQLFINDVPLLPTTGTRDLVGIRTLLKSTTVQTCCEAFDPPVHFQSPALGHP
jgi:1-pyrroline-5-carboxylate dehydrogenase